MAKGMKREKQMAEKRAAKAAAMAKPGFQSKYAKKVQYLKTNGGMGWDYSHPKPWA
jgi:hypothetical protein